LFDILAVLKQSNVALLAPVYNKRDKKGKNYSSICMLDPDKKWRSARTSWTRESTYQEKILVRNAIFSYGKFRIE